ncbi:MAG: AtpZ/AtpI family protein [Clostridia bacterium]|jgi:O-antigen ligase|nr:AtpZ/AtpI family protein [Clostridia bacterium]
MKAKKNNAFEYLNFGLSFGLTLVITLYLLYKGGAWLDQRLGTYPVFMALGIILALATVFRQLIGEIKELGQKDDQDEHNKT